MQNIIEPVSISKFYVFDNYEIIHEKTKATNHPILIEATEEALNHFIKENSYKKYDPLVEAPELYTEFAKLNSSNTKQILKFVKTYGNPLVTEPESDYFYVHELNSPLEGEDTFDTSHLINQKDIIATKMDTNQFLQKLAEYKYVFSIWEAINEENSDMLKSIKEKFEYRAEQQQDAAKLFVYDVTTKDNIETIAEKELLQDQASIVNFTMVEKRIFENAYKNVKFDSSLWLDWQYFRDKDLISIAKYYLAYLLSNLNTGKLSIEARKNEHGLWFNDLFEVAYFQLSQALINNIELKRCENCQYFFEADHKSRRFCPPTLGRKRSTCENTFNQREKRKRKNNK